MSMTINSDSSQQSTTSTKISYEKFFAVPSNPVFSLNIPEVKEINSKFTYNFYVSDEGTNEKSGVPNFIKQSSGKLRASDAETLDFTLRVPRYVTLNWTCISARYYDPYDDRKKILIKDNIDKIVSEDDFTSSKFINYTFSNVDRIQDAYNDINNDGTIDLGSSQATAIDNYVNSLLTKFNDSDDDAVIAQTKQQIIQAVENIEKIADRPKKSLNILFYDENGKLLNKTAGFDQLVSGPEAFLRTQINSLILPDLFDKVSLQKNVIKELNSFYKRSKDRQEFNVNDSIVNAVEVSPVKSNPEDISVEKTVVGYLIERYEKTPEGFVKDKTYTIENPVIDNFVDVFVKYGTTYYYAIRTVVKIKTQGYDDDEQEVRDVSYLVSSKPIITSVETAENIPPPEPVDINFVWDYKKSKLKIVWGMPVNSQRDIRQFQVFRRSSIHEPFELIRQKNFDFSTKKYQTSELIDGNRIDMTQEDASFVDLEYQPSMSHIDDDFVVDIEMLMTSKFIYSIGSVDAHGFVSNYSAQFEVSFDFYKNALVKKLISVAGAPKPYPNMKLNIDLFKDVIKTNGEASMKMKIYFMPEYFKIKYTNGRVEKMLSTSEDNAYYRMQFINLQNQKSDILDIVINDPLDLTK